MYRDVYIKSKRRDKSVSIKKHRYLHYFFFLEHQENDQIWQVSVALR